MSHYPFWPVTISILLCAAFLVAGRLKQNAQPLRLELADKGEMLLASPDASDNAKRLVRSYLDTAFSFRIRLLLAHLVIPGIAVIFAIQQIRGKRDSVLFRHEKNERVHALIEDLTQLHVRITLANNPILCISVVLSGVFYFTFAYLLVAILRGVIPSRIPAEEIAERIDYAYARIPSRLRGRTGVAHSCM